MTLFVLIPGAGGAAWVWHRVEPLLRAAGHESVAVQLPGDDGTAGLPQYADLVAAAASGRDDVVLTAASMGGFTAPLVCERIPVTMVVLVNAMIPLPGETAGAWWDASGATAAREQLDAQEGRDGFDLEQHFGHDVPPQVWAAGAEQARDEADIAFGQPCAFQDWPAVPIHVIAGADDRFFPADFQERVARERLGPRLSSFTRIAGGHLLALAQPEGLAAQLLRLAGPAAGVRG